MTSKEETRFRHLAGLIANAATELETQHHHFTQRIPLTLHIMEKWLSEMAGLCEQGVTPAAKKSTRTRRQISGKKS